MPFDFEGARIGKESVQIYASDNDIEQIEKLGLKHKIIINDVSAYYASRNQHSPKISEKTLSSGFTLGSMGGHFTLEEITSHFANLHALYPLLVSDSIRIGITAENRPIYAYRLGSGAASSPEILLTALHHAREPVGASCILYFAYDILKKYAEHDAEAIFLLEHRNAWIVPVVNPDGYEYNRLRYPYGGGMWRKNRRNDYGVDLNRNYGPFSNWDSDYGTSSTFPSDEVYRGESPFSEPETQAVRDLCNSHNFKLAINYHTFGNIIIYPYGEKHSETSDAPLYHALSADISRINKYSIGLDVETLGYASRGASDNWMYISNSQKGKIIATSPEIGTQFDGFWAPPGRIIPLCAENVYLNKMFLWSADVNIRPLDFEFNPKESSSNFTLTLQNIGVNASIDNAITVYLKSQNNDFTIYPDSFRLNSIASSEKQKLYFTFKYKDSLIEPNNKAVILNILQEGVLRIDTLNFLGGAKSSQCLYCEESDFNKWSGSWGLEYDPQVSKTIFTDTPEGENSYTTTFVNYINDIDLRNVSKAELECYLKWQVDYLSDGFAIEISIDSGASWHKLGSDRTVRANGYGGASNLNIGDTVYIGNMPIYCKQKISLNDYCGSKIKLRLGVYKSYNSNSFDGVHIFDFKLNTYSALAIDTFVKEDRIDDTEISLYPNPLQYSEQMNLVLQSHFSNEERIKIDIINYLGVCVNTLYFDRQAEVQEFPIDFTNLPSGMYFINCETNKRLLKAKALFVKK